MERDDGVAEREVRRWRAWVSWRPAWRPKDGRSWRRSCLVVGKVWLCGGSDGAWAGGVEGGRRVLTREWTRLLSVMKTVGYVRGIMKRARYRASASAVWLVVVWVP